MRVVNQYDEVRKLTRVIICDKYTKSFGLKNKRSSHVARIFFCKCKWKMATEWPAPKLRKSDPTHEILLIIMDIYQKHTPTSTKIYILSVIM